MLILGVFRNVNMNKMFILFVGIMGSLSLSAMNNDQLDAAAQFQFRMQGQNLFNSQINVLSQAQLVAHQEMYRQRRLADLEARQTDVERYAGIVPRPLLSRSNSFNDQVAQAVVNAQNQMDVVVILADLQINQNHQGENGPGALQ